MGPVVSEIQRRRILDDLYRGTSEGASFLLQGGQTLVPGYENGDHATPPCC